MNKMISIVLIEPEVPGNIGAIARSMANFDFTELILIRPHCNYLSDEACNRAKWGNRILKSAKIMKNMKQLRKRFDYIIGTTGRLGSDYNITRSPILSSNLPVKLQTLPKNRKVAIILGREGIGLTNEEIKLCDFITTIPTSKRYSSLNLSHAANIILYELSRLHNKEKEKTDPDKEKIGRFIMADRCDRDQLHKMFNSTLDTITFPTRYKKETQQTVWRRILEKSLLTKREARALMGFFAQLKKQRRPRTKNKTKKTTKK